jgi:hypothetical protein
VEEGLPVPVPVLVPDPVLLTLAVLLPVTSALRVSVTEAVRLWLAVKEADEDTVPVALLVLLPVPLTLLEAVAVAVMLPLGLAVGVTLPVAESELVEDSVPLTEAEPLAVIEEDEDGVAEAAREQDVQRQKTNNDACSRLRIRTSWMSARRRNVAGGGRQTAPQPREGSAQALTLRTRPGELGCPMHRVVPGTMSHTGSRNGGGGSRHSPVSVPLPDSVCEGLLLTLAVLLAVASALRVSVTDAVMLELAVNEAEADTVPVALLVPLPVPVPLVEAVAVEVMLPLGLAVGVTLPVAESEPEGVDDALTEAEPLAVIEAEEVRVEEAATKQKHACRGAEGKRTSYLTAEEARRDCA